MGAKPSRVSAVTRDTHVLVDPTVKTTLRTPRGTDLQAGRRCAGPNGRLGLSTRAPHAGGRESVRVGIQHRSNSRD